MNHLKKYEELDYRGQIEAENNLRRTIEDENTKNIEKKREEMNGKYLPQLLDDKKKRDDEFNTTGPGAVYSRKMIIDKVVDGLMKDLNKAPGYQSFREELLDFLNEFPKE